MDVRKLNIIKRRKQYLSIWLSVPPRQKKTTPNKGEIQQQFITEMKRRAMPTLINDIAAQIIVYTSDRRAPSATALAKNLIDIMHKEEYLLSAEEKQFLPFKDDKQIKYLFVKYVFIEGDSDTHIKIRPFSSFISDVYFLKEDDNLDTLDGLSESEYYRNLKANRDKYIELLSEKGYDAMISMTLERIQRDFGSTISITPDFLKTCFPKRGRFSTHFASVFEDWTELLLSSPIRLKLPGIPSGSEGQGATCDQKRKYKKKIRQCLKEYLEKFSILAELQYPIIVSVIYRPSKLQKEKDVDNIMLDYLVPAFNEVFAPPASIFRLKEYEHDGNKHVHILAREMDGQAIGFEIVQIPRMKKRHEPGEVYVGFRLDGIGDSLIDLCDRQIVAFLETDGGRP